MLTGKISFVFILACLTLNSVAKEISVGVLAFSGEEYAKKTWQPTIDYLNQKIPKHHFSLTAIEPSNIEYLEQLTEEKKLDFVITQPITFVELQIKYGASSILTLVDESKASSFGSVIFTKSGSNIKSFNDIKGKKIAGATPKGLGGWLIGYNEILLNDVDVVDEASVDFLGVQGNIVNAVIDNKIDVGIVRTGVIERMINQGKVKREDLFVLNQKQIEDFPYLISTRLYPEWALVKTKHISKSIAKQVASALLLMKPGSSQAKARGYWEWVTPVDYQPIHDLMKKLRVGVYQNYGKITLWQYIKDNIVLSSLFFLAIFVLLITGFWVVKLNHQLKRANYLIEQQNDTVLDSVSEGIYGVDLQGRCTFINKALTEITGWDREDLLGNMQHDILHHTHADGAPHHQDDCPVHDTFKDANPRFIAFDTFWKKDGSPITVEYTTNPLKDKFRNIVGSVVVFKDITQRIKTEQLQQQHEVELEHASRLNTMGEIVTGIAHELNQPLTAISTSAYAATRMIESKQYKQAELLDIFDVIALQSEHAAAVIRHMRQLSAKEQKDDKMIDINERINALVTLLRSILEEQRISLELNLAADLPKTLAQPMQIDQVILNLCKNAIDAMQPVKKKRSLKISTEFNNNEIKVIIADTGVGIEPSIREKLFEPFFSKKEEGMGIGLSISRSIIERHYGRLNLIESSTSGSVFEFSLPIKHE